MRWVDALKLWNGQNPDGHWCVPKKGTADYDKVKAIMAKAAPGEIATGKKVLKASANAAIRENRDKVLGDFAKGIQAKNAAAAAKAAEAAPKKVIAAAPAKAAPAAMEVPDKVIPDFIKNLKVGDTIVYGQSSGYMGDGGDGRDRGYTLHKKVLKVLGRGKYEVETQYAGNKPEVFAITSDGEWLRDTNHGRLTIYRINGHDKPDGQSDAAYAREQALAAKKRAGAAAKVEEDWTKGTKKQLVDMIDKHFAAQGKRLTGHKTADKDKLIEIIRKYKIKD